MALITRRLALVGLLVALVAGCATAWDARTPPRTVRLVLAVDDAFQVHAAWEDELQHAVRSVSSIFERNASIRFETVRVVTWQAPQLGDGRTLDHLLATIPAHDADVLIGVSGGCDHAHVGSARLFSRVALATTGCTPFLQKRTPKLQQLLAHELAHLFGAFHPAPSVRSIMRGGPADDWDSQMLRVVRLMRGFDFRGGVDGIDEPTRAAYGRIYAEGHDPRAANGIAVALRNRGRALQEAGEIDAARRRFEEATTVDPRWYQPYSDLGVWYARRQQPAEAARFFREAAERAAGAKPDVRLAIAAGLDAVGDRDGALRVYEETVRSVPTSVEARTQLGTALAQAGRLDEAIMEYRAALKLDPNDTRTRSNLVDALVRTSRSNDAVSEARVLVTQEPTSTQAWQRLVGALILSRRYSEAWTEVQRAATAGVVIPAAMRDELHRKLGTRSAPAR